MHRQNPLSAAFVGYSGGGARSMVDTANDDTGMQEMKGSFMSSEARDKIESPQNYGFTSVVRAATKGQDGKITDCAEAYINFMGGNRSFPVAAVMDDRRHRPWGLKEGENAQYDDLGQMTLMRRAGLFMLTLDGPDDSQKSSGGASGKDASGGQQQNTERFVSMRHVEKQKQPRPQKQPDSGGQNGGGGSGGSAGTLSVEALAVKAANQKNGQDFKHEGESVNTEVRASKSKVEFRAGDTVVGHYDKGSNTWLHMSNGDDKKSSKVDDKHSHIRHIDNTLWVDATGCWSSAEIQIKKDPDSTTVIKSSLQIRIEQLEARLSALEARLA